MNKSTNINRSHGANEDQHTKGRTSYHGKAKTRNDGLHNYRESYLNHSGYLPTYSRDKAGKLGQDERLLPSSLDSKRETTPQKETRNSAKDGLSSEKKTVSRDQKRSIEREDQAAHRKKLNFPGQTLDKWEEHEIRMSRIRAMIANHHRDFGDFLRTNVQPLPVIQPRPDLPERKKVEPPMKMEANELNGDNLLERVIAENAQLKAQLEE